MAPRSGCATTTCTVRGCRATPYSGVAASTLAAAFGDVEPVVTGEYRLGNVRHIVASPATAARDLGFRAQTRFAEAFTGQPGAVWRTTGNPGLTGPLSAGGQARGVSPVTPEAAGAAGAAGSSRPGTGPAPARLTGVTRPGGSQ